MNTHSSVVVDYVIYPVESCDSDSEFCRIVCVYRCCIVIKVTQRVLYHQK